MLVSSTGLVVLPLVAYLVPNWRILLLVLFSPLVIVWGVLYRSGHRGHRS